MVGKPNRGVEKSNPDLDATMREAQSRQQSKLFVGGLSAHPGSIRLDRTGLRLPVKAARQTLGSLLAVTTLLHHRLDG